MRSSCPEEPLPPFDDEDRPQRRGPRQRKNGDDGGDGRDGGGDGGDGEDGGDGGDGDCVDRTDDVALYGRLHGSVTVQYGLYGSDVVESWTIFSRASGCLPRGGRSCHLGFVVTDGECAAGDGRSRWAGSQGPAVVDLGAAVTVVGSCGREAGEASGAVGASGRWRRRRCVQSGQW
ncbi:uncharacterized protein LOC131859672 [Cryptomeria japonica]|uniref:uncharacterized protein LOC131859672 n=1 Tax=Cryptomeria japonica TaxID=3369 RepID=UPI0027DA5DB6|nr:uncharacterized protein LOC131859672 [Cryptomeria japonica]